MKKTVKNILIIIDAEINAIHVTAGLSITRKEYDAIKLEIYEKLKAEILDLEDLF